MSEEGPGEPSRRTPGTHRARRGPASYVLPVVLAGLVVLAVVLGIAGWLRSQSDGSATPLPSRSEVAIPSTSTPAASTPAPSPTTTRPTPSATPSPTRTAKPTPTPTAKPRAPVVVLNQTQVPGLAARTAAQLRAKGWTVTATGNWRGSVPSTTVYYPPGRIAPAQALAKDLGVSRIRPVVSGMLTTRLTVILTGDL